MCVCVCMKRSLTSALSLKHMHHTYTTHTHTHALTHTLTQAWSLTLKQADHICHHPSGINRRSPSLPSPQTLHTHTNKTYLTVMPSDHTRHPPGPSISSSRRGLVGQACAAIATGSNACCFCSSWFFFTFSAPTILTIRDTHLRNRRVFLDLSASTRFVRTAPLRLTWSNPCVSVVYAFDYEGVHACACLCGRLSGYLHVYIHLRSIIHTSDVLYILEMCHWYLRSRYTSDVLFILTHMYIHTQHVVYTHMIQYYTIPTHTCSFHFFDIKACHACIKQRCQYHMCLHVQSWIKQYVSFDAMPAEVPGHLHICVSCSQPCVKMQHHYARVWYIHSWYMQQ